MTADARDHAHVMRARVLQDRLRRAVVSVTIGLGSLIAAWVLRENFSVSKGLLALGATLPLWIALPRLLAGHRRTYAWMTLAVVPYLALALMEAIANPAARWWAGTGLFGGFALFVLLIGYLRVSRDSS